MHQIFLILFTGAYHIEGQDLTPKRLWFVAARGSGAGNPNTDTATCDTTGSNPGDMRLNYPFHIMTEHAKNCINYIEPPLCQTLSKFSIVQKNMLLYN
jgi:hypothetical protein